MSTAVRFVGEGDRCFGFCSDKPKMAPRAPDRPSPLEIPAVKELDKLIASDMFQMSLQDRERALEDVHGIITSEDEDPNFVNSCLLQMESVLNLIKPGSVYEEAERLSEGYVRNRHKRVMFLRAEYYDPVKAAERMLRHFEVKKELFGSEKLVKTITISDLDEDDLESLKRGEGQISPFTDAAGRPVVTFAQKLRKYKRIENLHRAIYYIFMSAMESREAQIKGIVCIYYNVNTPQASSANSRLRSSLPIHFASLHLCVDEIPQIALAASAISKLTTRNRVRYRVHVGSYVEVLYALVSFGIPRNAIPVGHDGQIATAEHLEWVQRRMEMEHPMTALPALSSSNLCHRSTPYPANVSSEHQVWVTIRPEEECKTIDSPDLVQHPIAPLSMASPESHISESSNNIEFRPNDVFFGRGKAAIDHPGNIKFRRLVDVYMCKYEEADRLGKTCIAEAIVQMIQESNGRFLKREGDSEWEEVDVPSARKKVAHAFRNRRTSHGFGGK